MHMSRCARDGKPFVVARGPLSRDTLVPDIAICLIGHAISHNRVRGDEFHVEINTTNPHSRAAASTWRCHRKTIMAGDKLVD